MNLRIAMAAAAFAAVIGASPVLAEESSDDIRAIVENGEVNLDFRYRYEFVDQDGFSEDADASTLRSRLSLKSGLFYNTQFFVEVEDVREVFSNNFNNGEDPNEFSKYPTVADVEGTELNQAYMDYKGFENINLRLYRQRINLDNQRFVGGVGWRQNEQTYDALSGSYTAEKFDLFYSYVNKVRRIFGDDSPVGKHKQDNTHIMNGHYKFGDWGTLGGYFYNIDNEDAPRFSNRTFGIRFNGKYPLESVSLRYFAELAYQEDVGDAPVSYDANYYHLDFGVIISNFDVGFAYEVLEGDNGADDKQFKTPFATLHKFNGWADKFLAGGLGNLNAGLVDANLKFKATFAGFTAMARYHDFEADDGGTSYGEEIDLSLSRGFGKHFTGLIKYADYDADNFATDTKKVWVQGYFKF
jgi:hypothetical protein